MKHAAWALGLLILAALLMFGETFEHKEAGISIWFPDAWTVDTEEDVLEADAPDGEAYVQLMLLDFDDLDDAINNLESELDPMVEDFTPADDGRDVSYNGLNGYLVAGEGTVDEMLMSLSVLLVATPSGQVGMLVTFCPKAVASKYEQDFKKILESIKPLSAGPGSTDRPGLVVRRSG